MEATPFPRGTNTRPNVHFCERPNDEADTHGNHLSLTRNLSCAMVKGQGEEGRIVSDCFVPSRTPLFVRECFQDPGACTYERTLRMKLLQFKLTSIPLLQNCECRAGRGKSCGATSNPSRSVHWKRSSEANACREMLGRRDRVSSPLSRGQRLAYHVLSGEVRVDDLLRDFCVACA